MMIDRLDTDERVTKDLDTLEVMAEHLEAYFHSDAIYFPTGHREADMPMLTLGGFLMRQQRVLATVHRLSEADSMRLAKAMVALRDVTSTRVAQTEARATRELDARIRQWRAVVDELQQDCEEYADSYSTAVEARVMAGALLSFLVTPPYQLDRALEQSLAAIDRTLLMTWIDGPFLWPSLWQAAYPQPQYWWLYGRPCDY